MKQPVKVINSVEMTIPDALQDDRWRLDDPYSVVYSSRRYNIAVHIWKFTSISPLNPTRFMLVGWATGPNPTSPILIFGCNDVENFVSLLIDKLLELMQAPRSETLTRDDKRRYPWIRFVTEILSGSSRNDLPLRLKPEDSGPRTVDTMLTYITVLADLVDPTSAGAVAHLSHPIGPPDAITNMTNFIRTIGHYCGNQEMEAVFWPNQLWNEALNGAEIFTDSNVPGHYIPDGPQLWYFEQMLPSVLDPSDLRYSWWTPQWKLTSVVLLPTRLGGSDKCFAIYILTKEMKMRDGVDDFLPRILLRSVGCAGEPCPIGFAMIMAGTEFMQEVLPRTPFVYSPKAKRDAESRGKKLQPYSIMEVRRVERPDNQNEDSTMKQEGGSGREYHYSFFQRRHRRKLKEPRKSDGVQVIRVAAGQKFKHLPLLPESQQKVTKVTR